MVAAPATTGMTPRGLMGVGQGIVLGLPEAAATGAISSRIAGLSVEDMEEQLQDKGGKRTHKSGQLAPLTARALLEENRRMMAAKQERRAMQRKNSQEEFEKLVMQDRLNKEGEKARALCKRSAQRELAEYYKTKINSGHLSKTSAYNTKLEENATTYFPFVEGEGVDEDRKAKGQQLREEMRGFLQDQRTTKPPRKDRLLTDVHGIEINYPVEPNSARSRPRPALAASARAASEQPPAVECRAETLSPEPSTYLARHPRFLTRPVEHMTRRMQDTHVRTALEEKVLQTKAELESASRQRDSERQQFEDGISVMDAVHRDKAVQLRAERSRNAEVLRAQIEARRLKQEEDRQTIKAEKAGYWGPEEKQTQGSDLVRSHCSDLIKQIEVDQVRKMSDRGQRLRQERQLIDNCIAEMSQDRAKEREKLRTHREVLTTTWESQKKIKQAQTSLQKM